MALNLLQFTFISILCAIYFIIVFAVYIAPYFAANDGQSAYNDLHLQIECYLYLVPISWESVYFHYWESLFASMRISKWSFKCTNTTIYLPERNSKFTNLSQVIFGDSNVRRMDQMDAETLHIILSNIASYFNTDSAIEQLNGLKQSANEWFYPIQNIILTQNIPINYAKYGAFGSFIKDTLIHAINRKFTYLTNNYQSPESGQTTLNKYTSFSLDDINRKYTYIKNGYQSQQWLLRWRKYLIQKVLRLNRDKYNIDYYLHKGYITIINRKSWTRTIDRRSINTFISALRPQMEHISSGRMREVSFEDLGYREQLKVVLESSVIITAHGSGEINGMMMHPSFSIMLELCPYYLHCHFTGEFEANHICPGWFQQRLSAYNIKGFALEVKNVNCSVADVLLEETKINCTHMQEFGNRKYQLMQYHGFSHVLNMNNYEPQIVESIKKHFMFLHDAKKNEYSLKEYKSFLEKVPFEVNPGYDLKWESFISHYCGKPFLNE